MARRRGPAWIVPVVLFLATFGVYGATAARHLEANDAYAASVGAWRIATTGRPWLDGVDRHQLAGTTRRGSWMTEAPNGHVVAQRMAGPIIVGIPFYWLLDHHADPRQFSIAAGGIAAAGITALAVLFLFLAVRRKVPDHLALVGSLAFGFATPTWSVSANGLWTHCLTQMGIAGAAWAASRDRFWLAGIFLGIGMFGRPHVAVIAAVLGLGVGWSRRSWRPAIGLAVPTLTALTLLVAWNRWYFGGWSIGGTYGDGRFAQAAEGYGGTGSTEQLQNYLGFLFAADRGFFVWSPILLLLVPAVVRAWRALPDWSRWLIPGGLLYTLFQLRLNYFAGGTGFFAYRHGLELLTCLTPAFVLALPRAGRVLKAVGPPLVGAQFAAFTVGATVDAFWIPLDEVWTDNGFAFALRTNPVVLGAWLAICVMAGSASSLLLRGRPSSPARRWTRRTETG